jgi:branched-chain amino acid transport system substrate-binding protein
MKRPSTFRTILVFAAALALGAAGSSSRASAAGEPYELTAILSLSGIVAFTGKAMQQSLQVIEGMVNTSGGIKGHPLKITVVDDQSNPQIAVQLANQAIGRHAPVILGPAFSATCLAVAPLVAKAGPVEYCFSPAIRPARGGFTFSASVSGDDQARAYLRYFRDRHWNRVAFLSSTDATGQTYDRSFDFLLALPENRALQAVAHEHFNGADISVSAQLERIKAARPDVLVAVCSGTPFGTVLRGVTDSAIALPIATLFSNMTYAQMEQYKAYLPATLLFAGPRSMSFDGTRAGPVRESQRRYFDSFAKLNIRPDSGHTLAWDSTWVVIDALRRLGTEATAEQVRDYINNLHGWVGINGVYDFGDGEQRGIGINGVIVSRWNAAAGTFSSVSRPGGAVQ